MYKNKSHLQVDADIQEVCEITLGTQELKHHTIDACNRHLNSHSIHIAQCVET